MFEILNETSQTDIETGWPLSSRLTPPWRRHLGKPDPHPV